MSTLTKLAIVGLIGLVLTAAVAFLSGQQHRLSEAGHPAIAATSEG